MSERSYGQRLDEPPTCDIYVATCTSVFSLRKYTSIHRGDEAFYKKPGDFTALKCDSLPFSPSFIVLITKVKKEDVG